MIYQAAYYFKGDVSINWERNRKCFSKLPTTWKVTRLNSLCQGSANVLAQGHCSGPSPRRQNVLLAGWLDVLATRQWSQQHPSNTPVVPATPKQHASGPSNTQATRQWSQQHASGPSNTPVVPATRPWSQQHARGPSNTPVHRGDGSTQTIVRAATLRSLSVSVSAQDGIAALGKAHTRSAPSLGSLPKVALETVPIFAWLNTNRSRYWKVECRPLPFSTPLSFRRPML